MSGNSIDVPGDDGECAFCAYLSGRRRYTILGHGKLTAVLVTREQRGVSHLLVVPIGHRPTILDLANDEADAVMWGIRQAAALIDRAEQSTGIAIWQNNGVPASQTIAHLHFHVAGTLDGGGTDWGEVRELSTDETDAIAARLLAAGSLQLK